MWNPFKAIGDVIGRVLGREETAQPVQQAEQPQERGFLSRAWDRMTGADQRREEIERERRLEEREQQLEERQRQVEERERALPPPGRDLPKFGGDHQVRDDRVFDGDIAQEVGEAVADFIADRGGLDGLNTDAREWLQSPTISEIFAKYWQSGGFSSKQVWEAMKGLTNMRITEGEDGSIHVEFDYEADVEGYPVHGHASN